MLVLLTWLLLDDNIILYIDDVLGRYLKKISQLMFLSLVLHIN